MAKYHKYVFDHEKRKLIGAFEEMYKAENLEGFDSWQNNDVRHLRLRLAMEILRDYNFDSVLELGCGKGTASQFLNNNNKVLGVDISPTAIEKAKASYPDI
jgi:SAM-dependent methyltransferase